MAGGNSTVEKKSLVVSVAVGFLLLLLVIMSACSSEPATPVRGFV